MKSSWRAIHAAGLGLGLLVALGSSLPWATASLGGFSISRDGMQDDGVFTLPIGLAIAALAFVAATARLGERLYLAGLLVGGAVIGAVGIHDWIDFQANGIRSDPSHTPVHAGVGLVLTTVCGVALVGAAIYTFLARSRSPMT